MLKISCIIPLYNAQKYIKNTLVSLLNQTYTNFEIIIVNDGSTDDSIEVLKEFLHYKNIKVINQINLGPSVARNTGIQEASGTYIHFLDSDDEVESNCYEDLIKYIDKHKHTIDILIFDYYKYYSNGKKVYKKRKLLENKSYNSVNEKKEVLQAGVVPWNKLYRRDFLLQNNLFFIEKIEHEDVPFFWQTIISALNIYYTKGYYIKYNQNTSSRNTNNKIASIIDTNKLILNFLSQKQEYSVYKSLFTIKMLKSYVSILHSIKGNKYDAFKLLQNSVSTIQLKNYNISFTKYIKFSLLMKGNYFFYIVLSKIF